MRLNDIADSHRRLLRELTRRISKRLSAQFIELPSADGPNIGIQLRERNQTIVGELPEALLLRAESDVAAREAIRVRIKTTRDRMLFQPEPAALPRNIGAGAPPPPERFGYGGNQPRGRGRR